MLKALGYRLLVKPDDFNSEHEVKGTDIVLEIVHNIGENIPWAKVGDHVMYSRYGGKRIEDPETGKEVILLDDGDVLCKIEEN